MFPIFIVNRKSGKYLSARQMNIPDFHIELEKQGNNLGPLSSNSRLVVSLHFMFIEMASVAGKVVQ